MQLVKPKYLIFYNNCEDDNVGINMGCVCEQTKHIYVVVYSVSMIRLKNKQYIVGSKTMMIP